jgi:polysaccharide pyruvyl transferase WcaK-like protein
MTVRSPGRHRGSARSGGRVGLFGVIGTDNIGNEGMLEAVVTYLRAEHPEAVVDFMCTGPEKVTARYGAPAISMNWYHQYQPRVSGVAAIILRTLGKGVDAWRVASWVRKHDIVIVPGAGVLEATLPVGPWWYPYAMFLVSGSGRLFHTKVALVSVGASVLSQRLTRLFFTQAASRAFYRSYRDAGSYDAMRQAGIDVTRDHVYPDLAFALPVPPAGPSDRMTVGIGVMDYRGTNDDRPQADQIHAAYVEKMKRFVLWLADAGYRIKVFGGDSLWDDRLVQEILADLRTRRPQLEPMCAVAAPARSLDDLMRQMAPVGTVVAIRYHNVLCALKLCKPTISISYARKHDLLMADMGLSEFTQFANTLDVDRLIAQFTELTSRSGQLTQKMAERNAENARLLDQQFAELTAILFSASTKTAAMAATKPSDDAVARDKLALQKHSADTPEHVPHPVADPLPATGKDAVA